ncbi:hypothetical protein NIES2119_08090 [[Phormidium ambiguum] IAM M-71]|uniref:Uncharacterized protein n=1 Tax=[Phormidium ambiguum] IAM M-71 TaxID=454136 RepID=A0A1U7IP91_9CYAN|nr:hypothetical protein [Phormidium ambiguum]OKH39080.1 hypothetical protein NIES2119_08090 [Phormidium ambiguum IAM M-71]
MPDIWINLGTILPKINEWEDFPLPSVTGSFIRITFLFAGGEGPQNTRSFLLLRRIWYVTTPPSVERAFKIWPSNYSNIIHNPIRQDFIDNGLTVCEYQAKVGFRYRHRGTIENAYQVMLEEL